MTSPLRVAAIQMASGPEREGNLKAASRLVAEAVGKGARLVVLPEMFNVLGDAEVMRGAGETLDGPSLTWAKDTARRHKIWLVAGSIMEKTAGEARCYNTSCLFDPEGTRRAVYRKIHLFDNDVPGAAFHESERVLAGKEIVTADVMGIPTGFAICYDLRFPELFRTMAVRGARVIVLASAFTERTGRDHWEVLVRARAIEDQVFVIASDQCGATAKGLRWFGNSMIVDAWGKVLARAGEKEEVIVADLDFAAQERVRADLPSLRNRRLGSDGEKG